MTKPLFSNFSCDFYVRRREMKRGAQSITIYAECHSNQTGANNDYYALDLYLSGNDYTSREFIVGVTFGKAPMEQKVIDTEIDRWIEKVTDETYYPFAMKFAEYMQKMKVWNDVEGSILKKLRSVPDDEI